MDMKTVPLASGNLFRVERYSDMTVGEIIVYIPMTADLVEDPIRQRVYQGTTNLTFSNGQSAVVTFPIPAKTFPDALSTWEDSLHLYLLEMESNATKTRILTAAGVNASRKVS